MDAGGDDFVIVRSKRQKRPTFKQKLLEDSEESEGMVDYIDLGD